MPLDFKSLMQEIEASKPRAREKTRHVLNKNSDGGRTLQIANVVGEKSKNEMIARDYRVTIIYVGHSLWGQEFEEMKVNLETIVS